MLKMVNTTNFILPEGLWKLNNFSDFKIKGISSIERGKIVDFNRCLVEDIKGYQARLTSMKIRNDAYLGVDSDKLFCIDFLRIVVYIDHPWNTCIDLDLKSGINYKIIEREFNKGNYSYSLLQYGKYWHNLLNTQFIYDSTNPYEDILYKG